MHVCFHLAVALLLAVAKSVKDIFVRRQLHPAAANLRKQCSRLTMLPTHEQLRSPSDMQHRSDSKKKTHGRMWLREGGKNRLKNIGTITTRNAACARRDAPLRCPP